MVEDCEEAFVKNPDGRPLVLYLRTEEDHNLNGPIRQLLERVNAADKAAKIKVLIWLISLEIFFFSFNPFHAMHQYK